MALPFLRTSEGGAAVDTGNRRMAFVIVIIELRLFHVSPVQALNGIGSTLCISGIRREWEEKGRHVGHGVYVRELLGRLGDRLRSRHGGLLLYDGDEEPAGVL